MAKVWIDVTASVYMQSSPNLYLAHMHSHSNVASNMKSGWLGNVRTDYFLGFEFGSGGRVGGGWVSKERGCAFEVGGKGRQVTA
jgi:hypothetical protein